MNYKRSLISDFDGTLTQRDFYQLVAKYLLPSDAPDLWGERIRPYAITACIGVP
jgi:2-hydroxy-3-keto-5-methylthiopentenyl-1-phosphate phosphatase